MIGNLLEWISPNTDLGTQLVCARCHQRQFRCVKHQQMESEPPRDYLSVKKSPKKDP